MFPSACIHGRFQILHNEHFEYFQHAAAKYGRLHIGLSGQHRDLPGTSLRDTKPQNPLSYWERVEMWRTALVANGETLGHVIGPFPIESTQWLPDVVPRSCICTTTVRDQWNLEKIRRLEDAGYTVDVLYTDFAKAISGTFLRELIASGSPDGLTSCRVVSQTSSVRSISKPACAA